MVWITGRGNGAEKDEPGEPSALIGGGWDRAFVRGALLLGAGRNIRHTSCGAKNDRMNHGSYDVPVSDVLAMNSSFIQNLYHVSSVLGCMVVLHPSLK